MSYPKWVQRRQDIGAVLCVSEAEEAALIADWEATQAEQQAQAEPVEAPADPTPEALIKRTRKTSEGA